MYTKPNSYSVSELESLNPITDITFNLSKSIEDCYKKLKDNGYTIVSGDIRESCGGKYGAIGYKRYKDYRDDPITNIIGTVSYDSQPSRLEEKGMQYHMVISTDGYGNIHHDEGGCSCFLYYTRNKFEKPIRNLTFSTFKEERKDSNEVAQNSDRSIRSCDLDLATRRGFRYMGMKNMRSARYNYIYIERI